MKKSLRIPINRDRRLVGGTTLFKSAFKSRFHFIDTLNAGNAVFTHHRKNVFTQDSKAGSLSYRKSSHHPLSL